MIWHLLEDIILLPITNFYLWLVFGIPIWLFLCGMAARFNSYFWVAIPGTFMAVMLLPIVKFEAGGMRVGDVPIYFGFWTKPELLLNWFVFAYFIISIALSVFFIVLLKRTFERTKESVK